jgi:hypothetical protein
MRVLTEILQVTDDAQMEGRTNAVDHNAIVEAAGLCAGLRTTCPRSRQGESLLRCRNSDL